MQLLELSEIDAVSMLEGLLGRPIKQSEEIQLAKSIVRKVECLPLGISSVVGTVLETRCSLGEFSMQWERLEDIIADSDVRRINRPTSRYHFSLNTAWESSLTALNKTARFLMEILCLMDPDEISVEILKTGVEKDVSRNWTLLRGPRLLRSTGILLTASLISSSSSEEKQDNDRFYIHRLIRAYVRSQMSAEARQNAFDAATDMIRSVWPFPAQHDRTQGSYWMAQERYMPHVKSLQMIFDDSFENEHEDGLPPLDARADFCRLLNSAAWYVPLSLGPSSILIHDILLFSGTAIHAGCTRQVIRYSQHLNDAAFWFRRKPFPINNIWLIPGRPGERLPPNQGTSSCPENLSRRLGNT
jgi:hypothetical protein